MIQETFRRRHFIFTSNRNLYYGSIRQNRYSTIKSIAKQCENQYERALRASAYIQKPIYERIKRLENEGYIKNYVALIDNRKLGLNLTVFCNVSLAVHNDEHIQQFQEDIKHIEEIIECYSIGGIHDFLLKVVVEDLEAYNRFVFEKITKVKGIVKMQSSFVLSEMKYTTAMNLKEK